MTIDPILIRPFDPATDRALIYSSWIRSSHPTLPDGSGDPRHCADIHALIDRLLDDPATLVVIACSRLDKRVILGWICATIANQTGTIRYVYTKGEGCRRLGIARLLCEQVLLRLPTRHLLYDHDPRPGSPGAAALARQPIFERTHHE